jgi:hypothetical protein
MHVYVLGDAEIAMYVKDCAVGASLNQVDREELTDVFARSAGTGKMKISKSSPLRKTES